MTGVLTLLLLLYLANISSRREILEENLIFSHQWLLDLGRVCALRTLNRYLKK